MRSLRGVEWGPAPLPEFLTDQLDAHGFGPDDAGRCARLISEQAGTPAATALFVDLGACKFLEADVDGAIAAWRHAISSNEDATASRAMLDLGLLYEHVGLHESALGVLKSVADRNLDPFVTPAAMASARCQRALGRGEQAVETMARLAQRIMSADPERPELVETLFGLGEVARESERLDRAERAWRIAALSPESELQQAATAELLQLFADQSRVGDFLELLDHQHELNSKAARLVLDHALFLIDAGDVASVETIAGQLDSARFCSGDRFRLAELRVRSGDVNGAIDELETLLGDGRESVMSRAAYRLGEIYRDHEMSQVAVAMFDQVTQADDPYWSSQAESALGRLRDSDDASPAATGSSAPEAVASPAAQVAGVESSANGVSGIELAIEDSLVDDGEPIEILLDLESDSVPTEPAGQATMRSATASAGEPNPTASSDDAMAEVIVLDDFEAAVSRLDGRSTEPATAAAPASSAFIDLASPASPDNPYAALAPDDESHSLPANPYAELAPARIERKPPPDVQTGDWQSMLEEWPEEDPEPAPSAFSRHAR